MVEDWGKGENLVDEDEDIREKGKRYLKKFIDQLRRAVGYRKFLRPHKANSHSLISLA